MKRLIALLRREYWENKGAFRTTPLVIAGLNIVFLLMAIFTTAHIDSELYTFREAVRVWVSVDSITAAASGVPITSEDTFWSAEYLR